MNGLPTLAYDMCRCLDSRCPEREQCLRWLRRGDEAHRLVFSPSLYECESGSAGACINKISVGG